MMRSNKSSHRSPPPPSPPLALVTPHVALAETYSAMPRSFSLPTRATALATALIQVAFVLLESLYTARASAQIVPVTPPPPPASTLGVWPAPAPGQSGACTGQACADRFRDGQSLGYDLLQWGVANQKDPNRRSNLNSNRTVTGNDPTATRPTGGTMNTRDFLPGAGNEDDLNGMIGINNLNNLMAVSLAARRKANDSGCRKTYFLPKYLQQPLLTVRAYQTNLVVDRPATQTLPATYKKVLGAATSYQGPVAVVYPAFGYPITIRLKTIQEPTQTQPGLSLEFTHSTAEAVVDGGLVPTRIAASGGGFVLSTVGKAKDQYTVRGSFANVPMGGVNLTVDYYRVNQDFFLPHTQPYGVCQHDPTNCAVYATDGLLINMCAGSPYIGVADVYSRQTPNDAPVPTMAYKTLSDSAAVNRTLVSGVDPDVNADALLGGSRNTLAGSPPIVPQTGTYRPFQFSVSEMFSGCAEVRSNILPNGDAQTTRRIDIQTCSAQPDPNKQRSCQGTRALGFSPLGTFDLAQFKSVRSTKAGSCPAGTALTFDVPPVSAATQQQIRGLTYSTCPIATPHYKGTFDGSAWSPVSYEYRQAQPGDVSWGAWTYFYQASACSANPADAVVPLPVDLPITTVYGPKSETLCMPGRLSAVGLGTTNAPTPYTGRVSFSIRTIGQSQVVSEPTDPSPGTPGTFDFMQVQYNRLSVNPSQHFPSTLAVRTGSGSASNVVVNTYGSPADGWTITGMVDLVVANDITFTSDVKLVSANDIIGCQDYMGMLADKVCQLPPPGKMTCTDNRGLQTTVNGVTFGTTGPLSGVTGLLKPWGSPTTATLVGGEPTDVAGGPAETYVAEPLCFAASGPNLTCEIPGSNVAGWVNHFLAEPVLKDYVDNCALRTRDSPPATTSPLLSDASCRYLGPGNCVAGASGAVSGICYQREVLFDCGVTTTMPGPPVATGSTQVEQSCNSALRCIGTECHRPVGEASQDFAAATAGTEIINAIRRHTSCAETGEPPTSDTMACTPMLFAGRENLCLTPLTSQVGIGNNCCKLADDQAAGLDAGKYITMITLAWRLKETQFAQQALGNLGNLSGVTQAYGNVTNAVSATLKPITDSFATMMSNLGFSPTSPAIVNKTSALVTPDAPLNPFTQLSAVIEKKLTDMLGDVFTQMGLTLTPAAGAQLARDFMQQVSNVFFWYGVAQLVGQLIYSCNASQLTPGLGMARKGGNCHFIGQKTTGTIALQKRSVYCCFATPLARIMQENFRNGRQGVGSGTDVVSMSKAPFYGQALFGGWGTPKAPRCDGILPSDMLLIDWGAVDLSEWTQLLIASGMLPSSNADVNKRYALIANMTNTTLPNLGPNNTDTPQPGPDSPMDRTKAATQFMAKYGSTMGSSRDALEPQKTCFDDPKLIPWYTKPGPQSVTDIIEDLGGTGSYTSCGTGCVDVTLGLAQNNVFYDNCTKIFPQQQTFRVNRPDFIISAAIVQANWDDHIQMTVNDEPVYTSPQWYNTRPFGGNVCDLGKSWQLNAASACIGTACQITSPSPSGIDVTSYFTSVAPGGRVRTNTAVIVGGGGEGYAKMRVLFTPPGTPPPLPTDPADPLYRECVPLTGK